MCTAASYKTEGFYFGRTLDYDFSYGDAVTVVPRSFPFEMLRAKCLGKHYAIIGMACSSYAYPLFYDGMNEKGLCMAGLNFVNSTVYKKPCDGKDNIAQFELIPWILGQCASVKEAGELLKRINITDDRYAPELPAARLHWIIADKDEAITAEAVESGVRIYDNPAGVLTNDPCFEMQLFNLNNYMSLSPSQPKNSFSEKLPLVPYSRGMGGMGLPGDVSSMSRFVRAAFVKMNSVSGSSERESVSQLFHILNSVEQQRGCCMTEGGKYEMTLFTSCCSAQKGIYYYTSYDNHQITAVDMNKEELDGSMPVKYPLITEEQIKMQN